MPCFRTSIAVLIVLMSACTLPATADARSSSYNTAPTISGTPATAATIGIAYTFQPTATDANRDTLTFTIKNKPSWVNFNTGTGLMSGIPQTVGTYSNIVISVSDGKARRSLPAFSIQVSASTTSSSAAASITNTAPTISGTPITSVTAGTAYSFTPTAADANGDGLGFSIANKPAWASFNTATGRLSGTPGSSSTGSYAGVTISVSDGTATTSLAPFTLTVNPAPVTTASATLTWTRPTLNSDGTALTDLSAYRIYYGVSGTSYSNSVVIGSDLTSYTIGNLATGSTWHFAISSINTSGVEGSPSNPASTSL
jgi:hypothetical protein